MAIESNSKRNFSGSQKGPLSISSSLSLSLSHDLRVYFQIPIFASGNLFLSELAYT